MRKLLLLCVFAMSAMAHASPAVDLTTHFIQKHSVVYAQEQAPEQVAQPAAQPQADEEELPKWLESVLMFAESVPYVGPYVGVALKWVAFVSALFTFLATSLDMLAVILAGAGMLVGLRGFADKVKALHAKISPYLKWLSIYNVQKKPKV